jgi:hypothetical protein
MKFQRKRELFHRKELKDEFEQTILPNMKNATCNYLYHSLLTAISKEDNKMFCDICIIGEPIDEGEIKFECPGLSVTYLLVTKDNVKKINR